MRFGIISPRIGFNDGQGRVNLEIASEIVRQGHEVALFSEQADQAALPQARSIVMEPPSWLPTRLLRDQLFAWRSGRHLHEAVNRCDAVLANGFVTWARSDINAVHFVHGSWLRSPFHPWQLQRSPRSLYARIYSSTNAMLERGAMRRSRRVVAVSETVRQELLAIGVPGDRIDVIANGVDTAEFSPGQPDRQRFHLPDAVPMALFAGDLKSPRKNLETVLRALQQVPSLHLAVAGGTQGSPYPALAKSMGLEGRVHFLGFITDMPGLMRSVDLFVLPSRYEPFGLVLLEAMASGLPVVTACSAGGADLITSRVGVVLADSDDSAALAGALRPLVDDPEYRRTMAAAAHENAIHHSWRAMANRYIALLTEAAERRKVGTHA
jgi:glycosyltransferase involved in cell wall biosynthesis